MWAALAAIAASVVVAWLSLTGGKGGDEAVVVGADYDLGSGQMFDAIAPRYDLINKVISLGLDMRWRKTMIDGLQLQAGDRVMDMATGTADVAIMMSKELIKLDASATRQHPLQAGDRVMDMATGTADVAIMMSKELIKLDASATRQHPVIGIDPSANMLHVGRKKVEEAGLSSSVQLHIGDAQDLADVPDGSIDKLTMAFGIRNVPNRLKALKEFRRIMVSYQEGIAEDNQEVPAAGAVIGEEDGAQDHGERDRRGVGSIVAILELQNPESGFLAFASRGFVKYAAPVLGWVISGSGAEYGHLKNSIMAFPSVQEWTELMAEAGLAVFSHQTMGFGTVHLYLARPT